MVCTNLNEPPQKKAKDITINEEGSNPPQERKENLPPGDKGKRKENIAKKGIAIETQVEWSEPEYYQPLTHRQNRLRDRPQPTPTEISSDASPPESDAVPASTPPLVAPALPIAPPPPRLLNRLKVSVPVKADDLNSAFNRTNMNARLRRDQMKESWTLLRKKNEKAEKNEENDGLRIAESTWQVAVGSHFTFCSSMLSAEGKDQVGGKGEQLANRLDVPRGSTMSPNGPEHNDAEGWCKTTMNYIKG
uniref:Uncharacterized protein n=1 Tax=Solanum tuberosum TaxID=4113 RepID=M1DI22_SOLTU